MNLFLLISGATLIHLVSYRLGYGRGCKAGTQIGLAALENYHQYTMDSLRSLR